MTSDELRTALEPLREALLAHARSDAGQTLARAHREAAQIMAVAEQEAEELAALARARGDAEAAEVMAAERARARRAVRSADLSARAAAHERLRAEVVAAVRRLRGEPDYPRLRDRLADRARRLLGPDAEIVDAPGGGVYGRAPGARVDCSLDALAEQALVELAPELDGVWEP